MPVNTKTLLSVVLAAMVSAAATYGIKGCPECADCSKTVNVSPVQVGP